MSTFEIFHRMGKTPPPQVFSSSRDGWHDQATSQQQHRGSLSEQVPSPWRHDRSDGNVGFCAPGIGSARPAQNTMPDDGSSPRGLERSSQYGTTDPYGTVDSYGTAGSHGTVDSYGAAGWYGGSNASCPQLGTMSLGSSPPEYLYQIPFTIPQVASPTAFSPTPSDYQHRSPIQAVVYTTHQTDGYFAHNPNHARYPVGQEQKPASGRQGQEPYPDPNTGILVVSPPPPPRPPPPPPYQPTRRSEKGGTVAGPNPGPHVCSCGTKFGRQTDLERHLWTSKRHNKHPRGPACPVDRCSYPLSFTRADNFKVHYMKQHGATKAEADEYIRNWKD